NFEPEVLASKDIIEGEKIKLSFKINKPEKLTIMVLGSNWEIFVHPDDSLTFSIYEGDNGTAIQFRGEHSAQYNYKQKLFARRDTSLTPPSFHYLKDLTKYINVLNEWYKSRSIFLENYSIHYHLQKNFVHYSKVNL